MRMRKKPNLSPRMEQCARLLVEAPEVRRGRWREPSGGPLYLELGCGKGRFTCGTAETIPQALLVAVERVPEAMVVAMERAEAAGLSNVLFIDGNADKLGNYFAPGEAERIYLNFSDPWPSNRHAKRRLTHPNFLRLYWSILPVGGQIHLKTDNQALFEWSLLQFPKVGYALSEVTRDLHGSGIQGIMTDYEEKFHNLGFPIHRCVATKT